MPKEKITISSLENEVQRTRKDLEDLETYINDFSSFLPLAICVVTPVGAIIDVNKAFESLSGFKLIEIAGRQMEDIFLEKGAVGRLKREIMKREIIRGKELTLISKGEKSVPVSVSLSLRRDEEGNFIGLFLAIFDITDIKEARTGLERRVEERTKELKDSRIALMNILEDIEEARKKAELEKDKTLAIITNFSDGLLVLNEEDKISLVNPQAEKFLGLGEKDVVGRDLLALGKVTSLTPLTELLKKEKKTFSRKELAISDKLILEASLATMFSGKTNLGKLLVLHDITREKMIEKMKTEFVSLAAHQLRTPLSAIKWTLQMLLEGDIGQITKEQKEFLGKTYKSNERMIGLINDLLDVTRIEEGRYLFKPVPAGLEDIVQAVVSSHRDEIERKKIKLQFKKPRKKMSQVMMDVEKMRLVIQNLLENAIKYTPDRGKIIIQLEDRGKELKFKIEDTGVGIPKDQQKRVFGKFFRGANVIRMETEGSGLGTFIAKNIIDAHGGKIWFESEEGKGTVFCFTLPVKKEFEEFLKEF